MTFAHVGGVPVEEALAALPAAGAAVVAWCAAASARMPAWTRIIRRRLLAIVAFGVFWVLVVQRQGGPSPGTAGSSSSRSWPASRSAPRSTR